MPAFWGFVALGSPVAATFATKNTSGVPIDASPAPTYRIYGPAGVMASGTGSLSAKDSGVITAASNASPIVITCVGHNLTTGTRVTVASVGGNTAANGEFNVTRIDANTFSLDSSTGNGAYTSGGTWHAAGLYNFTYTPTSGNGFGSGVLYSVVVYATVGANNLADIFTFQVT